MKRLVTIFMVIAVLLSMTACAGTSPSTPAPTTTPATSPITTPAPAEPSTQPTPSLMPVSGSMQAYFFDVGQADATLLIGDDFSILIDAGDYTKNDVVPYLIAVGQVWNQLVIPKKRAYTSESNAGETFLISLGGFFLTLGDDNQGICIVQNLLGSWRDVSSNQRSFR